MIIWQWLKIRVPKDPQEWLYLVGNHLFGVSIILSHIHMKVQNGFLIQKTCEQFLYLSISFIISAVFRCFQSFAINPPAFVPKNHLFGSLNQQLLREGHTVQAQLHPQIAARHHEGLGLGDDTLNVGEGLTANAPWKTGPFRMSFLV